MLPRSECPLACPYPCHLPSPPHLQNSFSSHVPHLPTALPALCFVPSEKNQGPGVARPIARLPGLLQGGQL